MTVPTMLITENELTLYVPVEDLTAPIGQAVSRWLTDHHIDPAKVALGRPVVRDAVTGSLAWHEHTADNTILRRWRFSPPDQDRDRGWPASFPISRPALVLESARCA